MNRLFWGEFMGTFILVFFGIGSVALSLVSEVLEGAFQVALVWGIGLTLAITITRPMSGAHLNPAITLAMASWGDFPWRRVAPYFLAQFGGALLAAIAIWGFFNHAILSFEESAGLIRGKEGSEASAMIFGEYFPNPGGQPLGKLPESSFKVAFAAEFFGTGLLAFFVMMWAHPTSSFVLSAKLIPMALGLTLTVLIILFSPLSMAGFNPARDLAPRVWSALAGWGSLPFRLNGQGWWLVYLVAPFSGASFGFYLAKRCFQKRSDF